MFSTNIVFRFDCLPRKITTKKIKKCTIEDIEKQTANKLHFVLNRTFS